MFCRAVHEVEVVASLVGRGAAGGLAELGPVKTEPFHRVDDAVDVFGVFFFGVGVVKAQVAHAAVVTRQAKVDADALGMAHVQVAVGLGREAGADLGGVGLALGVVGGVAGAACPAAGGIGAFFQIRFDDLAQKVAGLDGFGGCGGGCRLCVGGGGGTHSPILGGAYVANGTGAAGACTSRNNIAAVLCHPFGHLVRYARQRPTPPVGRLPSKRRFP